MKKEVLLQEVQRLLAIIEELNKDISYFKNLTMKQNEKINALKAIINKPS